MKRIGYLAALMILSSSAQAGEVHSFVVGGHHIRVEASRHCGSLSCISWSIVDPKPAAAPVATTQPAPAIAQAPQPPAPQQIQPRQLATPTQAATNSASTPPTQAVPTATSCSTPANKSGDAVVAVTPPQAPGKIELAATTTQSVPPPTPKAEPVKPTVIDKPAKTPTVTEKELAETPLGDWQTERKTGLVRIQQCGRGLCGYLLNASTNTTGETVLSNMKSKKDNVWAGDILSRSSGNTYYARMTLKAPNTLRVEACALGPFFCSANSWTRIVVKSDEMVVSRRVTAEPKS
jgi:hypothetical protein